MYYYCNGSLRNWIILAPNALIEKKSLVLYIFCKEELRDWRGTARAAALDARAGADEMITLAYLANFSWDLRNT